MNNSISHSLNLIGANRYCAYTNTLKEKADDIRYHRLVLDLVDYKEISACFGLVIIITNRYWIA